MKTSRFVSIFMALVLMLTVGATVSPAAAAGSQTLYVSNWTTPASVGTGITGRPTVLFDGSVYHLWYGTNDTTLYHTSSTDPANFGTGTLTTYDTTPNEVTSTAILLDGGTFYMIAYSPSSTKSFSVYTSMDGVNWKMGNTVFDASSISGWDKIDCPMLLKDDGLYRLYFQMRTTEVGNPYYIYSATSTTIDGTYSGQTLAVAPGAAGSWDNPRVFQPWVVKYNGEYIMYFGGYGADAVVKTGVATSKDGVTFTEGPSNPLFAVGSNDPSVILVDGTWHMWYGGSTGVTHLTATGPFMYKSIQTAINAASGGETILVAPGTYNEKVEINKANITLKSEGGSDATIIDVPEGSLTSGIKVIGTNLGVITVDGFTVKDFTENGIVQGMGSHTGTTVHVINNKIYPAGNYLRNGIQVSGDNSTVIGNFVKGAPLTPDWGSTGIHVVNASNTLVENNTISGEALGVDTAIGVTNYQATSNVTGNVVRNNVVIKADYAFGATTFFAADKIDGVSIEKNQILDSTYGIYKYIVASGGTISNVDGSPNWWGTIAGPSDGTIDDGIPYSPWCGDAACTFLVSKDSNGYLTLEDGVTAAQIQSALDTVPEGTTIVIPAGTYSKAGGLTISTPHTTIILQDGAVISNESPCFVVNANYTTIKSETIGGGKCVPTNNSNGIDVNSGLVNVVIDGLEIDGATGTDGIHFAGAVTDVLLDNNYIHNLQSDGIKFTVAPAGFVEIQGNLIRDNGGYGVNSPSSLTVDYNSWGTYAVPANAANFPVDGTKNTHVALSLVSSGTPWANQVVSGQTITYAVKADLKNATGADFTLEYPSFLTLGKVTMGDYFTSLATGSSVITTSAGTIHFAGVSQLDPAQQTPIAAISGQNLTLFTVTFTADGIGNGALNFVDSSAEFAMSPASGGSNNIYPAALTDATVKAIALPEITANGVEGYYLTGDEQREFTMTVTNTNGGNYSNVIFNYTITGASLTDIASFEFNKGGVWTRMDAEGEGTLVSDGSGNLVGTWGLAPTGFPMVAGFTDTYQFRIKFNTAKDYLINIKLMDLSNSEELAAYSNTARVYDAPTISSADLQGPYLTGVEQIFHVSLVNPATTGVNITHGIFKFVVANANLGDITSFKYLDTATSTYQDMPLTQSGNDLVGYFGPAFGFAITPGYSASSTFKITFAKGGDFVTTITFEDLDFTPDRVLATLPVTAKVYANFTVTGTFSMQGRVQRAGLPVMLTAASVPFGPYSGTTINALSSNITFNNVVAGTYLITTNQPRYLNITADLNKIFDLTANKALAALELKGGNAIWTDNAINISDASRVSSVYGQTKDNDDGDVNFDGKITIADLALVGGNYGLTSSDVYATWQP